MSEGGRQCVQREGWREAEREGEREAEGSERGVTQ
jgi:hypothetical protein